jgi:sporulation protein YlmC with PRC-barrel domain
MAIKNVLSASTLMNHEVMNLQGEQLGKIEDIMLNPTSGEIAYAVLSVDSILGFGGKLFALPWNKLKLDPENKCFILNANKEQLKNMPGFDKNNWPNMADPTWESKITNFYQKF